MTVNGTTFAQGTMPVTCATTNPTKGGGTGFTDRASYTQIGKTLIISWQFMQTTTGTAGSGAYLFSIPTGFTINTTLAPIVPSVGGGIFPWPFCYGTGRITLQAVITTGITAVVNNSTSFLLIPDYNPTTAANGYFPIGAGASAVYPFNSVTASYVIGVECIFPD